MTQSLFLWMVSAALLSLGAVILRQAARDYSTAWTVSRRLRQYVSPHLAAPWLGAALRRLLEHVGRRVTGPAPAGQLQELLLQAGIVHPSAPYVFAGIRFLAMIALGGLCLTWNGARHGAITPLSAAATLVAVFFLYRAFTILLKARVEARRREIRRELPYVLDLILMVLDSGVSIDQALHHVCGQIARPAPVCAAILSRYIADTEDGMPYDMALDRLAQRLAINEGRDFAGVLKQNLFQGGELSQPLKRLAADIGETRLAAAREQVGRKSVLLTLVMLAFFMPVLMVALAGPAVSDLTGTLHNVAADLRNSRVKR